MLVLSRRPDEKILLPTVPALIKVISSNGGLVRLGFEAPVDVPILREELARGERRSPPSANDDCETGLEPDRNKVRGRLNDLTLDLTLLRMELSNCDPVIRQTLDDIDRDLQTLRRAVRLSACDTVVGV